MQHRSQSLPLLASANGIPTCGPSPSNNNLSRASLSVARSNPGASHRTKRFRPVGANALRLLELGVLDLTGEGSEALDDAEMPFGVFLDER